MHRVPLPAVEQRSQLAPASDLEAGGLDSSEPARVNTEHRAAAQLVEASFVNIGFNYAGISIIDQLSCDSRI
jgi:hypothetical protein